MSRNFENMIAVDIFGRLQCQILIKLSATRFALFPTPRPNCFTSFPRSSQQVQHNMVELCLDPRRGYKNFGEAVMKEVGDLRFHLVLPGILDINLIMDSANKAFQPVGVNVWKAVAIRKKMTEELDDLILRKTDEDGQPVEAGAANLIMVATSKWLRHELPEAPKEGLKSSDTGNRF